jgi:hypothetical protein
MKNFGRRPGKFILEFSRGATAGQKQQRIAGPVFPIPGGALS